MLSAALYLGQAPRSLRRLSDTLQIVGMATVNDARLMNLAALARLAGSMEAVAERANTSAVYLSQLRNHVPDKKTGRPRAMGSALARRLEVAFDKERGWMDQLHDTDETAGMRGKALAELIDTDPTARESLLRFVRSRVDLAEEKRAEYLVAIEGRKADGGAH